MGNVVTSGLFSLFFRIKIKDTQSGLRAIPEHLFEKHLSIKQQGYEYEFECLINVARKEKIDQVSIQTIYEIGNPSSHFRPILDSTLIYMVFLRYVFFVPLIAFLDFIGFIIIANLVNSLVAFLIVRSFTIIIYFLIMRKIVFNSQKWFAAQLTKFLILVLFNLFTFSALFFMFGDTYFGAPAILYFACTIALFGFNFLAQRYIVFNR